jgi:hypothetical protein
MCRLLDWDVEECRDRIVRYPLETTEPGGLSPVESEYFSDRLRSAGLDIGVRVHLCRDVRRALPMALKNDGLWKGPVTSCCSLTRVNMLLDLFYLTIGIGSLGLCWLFVKACDRL